MAIDIEVLEAISKSYPTHCHLSPNLGYKEASDWTNIGNNSPHFAGTRFCNNNGAYVIFDFRLAKGEYTLTLGSWSWNASGILTLSISDDHDGFVTIDKYPYNAPTSIFDTYRSDSFEYYRELIPLTIPKSGDYKIKVEVTGKNPLSGGYTTNLEFLNFYRQSDII